MSIGHPDPKSQAKEPPSPGQAGILVVDEDPAFQLGLKTFLKEYVGFDHVFTARNGAEALETLKAEESIEVVTLDYEMPKMNGIEMLRSLENTDHAPVSVLMITGYPSEELETEFRNFNSPTLIAAEFVSKPIEFEKLEPLILKAHQELLAKKNSSEHPLLDDSPVVAEPETLEPVLSGSDELDQTIAELEAKLSAQTLQLNELQSEVRAQQNKWRTDVFLVIFLAVITWIAAEFGLFESLRPKWEQLKSQIGETIRPVENDRPETVQEVSTADPEPSETPEVPLPEPDGDPL